MIVVNDQGKIVYDSEDYTGRLERTMNAFREQGLFVPPTLPEITPEMIAAAKTKPMLVIDSMGAFHG
jgi:hypothetical protein